jgi:hypothetical protein
MAAPNYTSDAVPGSLSVTHAPGDSAAKVTSNGRCPRCERWRHEVPCSGVAGEVVHVGS